MEHKKQFDFLKGKFTEGRLSHAYLFSGQEGIGKKEFALELVKLISGKDVPGADAAIQKEQFPDLLIVKSINSKSSIDNKKDMLEIDVAQIREANNFLNLKTYYGNYKTVIIENADRLNFEAQNSFLKTLEEPKGKTLIILLSAKPDALLSTIFSRCQTITFFGSGKYEASKEEKALEQELLGIINAELAVKFQYTKKVNLEGDNGAKMLKVLQRYFRNVLLGKLGVGKTETATNYSIEKLKKIIRLIETLHKQLTNTNTSPKLALEILLIEL